MSAPILSLQIFNIPWSLLKKKNRKRKDFAVWQRYRKDLVIKYQFCIHKTFSGTFALLCIPNKITQTRSLEEQTERSWSKSGREWEVKTWWGLNSQHGVIFTDFHSGKRWKRWFSNSLSHILWSLFISRVSEQLCGSWGSLGKVAPGEAQRSEGNQNRVVREVYWSKTMSREGRRPLIALF